MANKDEKKKFAEAYEQLSPEAREFIFNVTIGMAMKHREKGNQNKPQSLRFYSLYDLEPIFGVSYRTLLRWVKTGYLPTVKIGGKRKISEEELLEFIKEKHIKTIDTI